MVFGIFRVLNFIVLVTIFRIFLTCLPLAFLWDSMAILAMNCFNCERNRADTALAIIVAIISTFATLYNIYQGGFVVVVVVVVHDWICAELAQFLNSPATVIEVSLRWHMAGCITAALKLAALAAANAVIFSTLCATAILSAASAAPLTFSVCLLVLLVVLFAVL